MDNNKIPAEQTLDCLLMDNRTVELDLYKVYTAYVIFNIDKPVSVFWSKAKAETELRLIRAHIRSMSHTSTRTKLNKLVDFHVVEIPVAPLAHLVEELA